MRLALVFAPAPAVGLHHRVGLELLAVLPAEFHVCPVGRTTEGATVDDQPLLGTLHPQINFGERCIWGVFEGGPDAAYGRVDADCYLDVDETVQVEDEVGELVVRGAEIHRSFKWRIEQRSPGFDVAVLGSLWALLCGELHPGADRLDVSLVKEG